MLMPCACDAQRPYHVQTSRAAYLTGTAVFEPGPTRRPLVDLTPIHTLTTTDSEWNFEVTDKGKAFCEWMEAQDVSRAARYKVQALRTDEGAC
jgi:hypothetical protein